MRRLPTPTLVPPAIPALTSPSQNASLPAPFSLPLLPDLKQRQQPLQQLVQPPALLPSPPPALLGLGGGTRPPHPTQPGKQQQKQPTLPISITPVETVI